MSCDCQLCNADEIVRLVKANDVAALDRITRCYGDHLLAVGRRVCGDAESARDAVQDALLAAGQRLEQFRGDGSVESWLVGMVANACRSRRRGRKNDPAWNQMFEEEAARAGGDSPETDTANAQLATALGEALTQLSAIDRAVVLLTQVDGWKAPAVAAALDLTPDAVRARLTRTRQRLREQLGPVWRDWTDRA